MLPRLLEERKKRLALRTTGTHRRCHSDEKGSVLQSSFIAPSSEAIASDCGFKDAPTSNNDDGPCCPKDFLTPRIYHVPLDETMVRKVRNRMIEQAQTRKSAFNADGENIEDDNNSNVHEEDEVLDLLVSGRIKLVMGFHPDQATEPCIDLARFLGVPYCVVPCCVFPAEFPNRRVRLPPSASMALSPSPKEDKDSSSTNGSNSDHELVPVRTYQQFLEYLRVKATTPIPVTSAVGSSGHAMSGTTLHTAYLDFPFAETAKNIVLYTLPPSYSDGGGSSA
jgi:hypothetical protein